MLVVAVSASEEHVLSPSSTTTTVHHEGSTIILPARTIADKPKSNSAHQLPDDVTNFFNRLGRANANGNWKKLWHMYEQLSVVCQHAVVQGVPANGESRQEHLPSFVALALKYLRFCGFVKISDAFTRDEIIEIRRDVAGFYFNMSETDATTQDQVHAAAPRCSIMKSYTCAVHPLE